MARWDFLVQPLDAWAMAWVAEGTQGQREHRWGGVRRRTTLGWFLLRRANLPARWSNFSSCSRWAFLMSRPFREFWNDLQRQQTHRVSPPSTDVLGRGRWNLGMICTSWWPTRSNRSRRSLGWQFTTSWGMSSTWQNAHRGGRWGDLLVWECGWLSWICPAKLLPMVWSWRLWQLLDVRDGRLWRPHGRAGEGVGWGPLGLRDKGENLISVPTANHVACILPHEEGQEG